MKDRDLAMKLVKLASSGVNRTWAAVQLREPYHRVLRVAKEYNIPNPRKSGVTTSITVDGKLVPVKLPTATRREWTPEEEEVALDTNRSAEEAAKKLGRTVKSVASKRYRNTKKVLS